MELTESMNPVARLLQLIRTFAREARSHNQRADVCWGTVLDPQPRSSDDEFLEAFLSLRQLHRESIRAVSSVPKLNREIYLRSLRAVESAFEIRRLSGVAQDTANIFSERVMADLEHCAAALADYWHEQHIEPASLEDVNQSLYVLFDEVRELNIPDQMRTVLLDHIEAMRRAIAEYHIRGADGLRTAVAGGVGALVWARQEIAKSADPGLADRLWATIGKLADLATVASTLPALTAGAAQLLDKVSGK